MGSAGCAYRRSKQIESVEAVAAKMRIFRLQDKAFFQRCIMF